MRLLLSACAMLLLLTTGAFAQSVCPRPTASGGVAICSPANGATVTSPVHLYVLGGSSVDLIEVWIDGTKVRQVGGNTLDSTLSLGQGQHRLSAFAKVNGTVTDSKTIYFSVSGTSSGCTQPSAAGGVIICSPPDGASVNSPVQVTASGGSSVTLLEAWIDGVKRNQASGNRLSFSIALASGQHRLTVIAKVGPSESARKTIFFSVAGSTAVGLVVEEVAGGLTIPWELVFAPDGRKFFTERTGRLRVISASGVLRSTPMYQDVSANTEAGMLGLALDPAFSTNHRLYLFHCPNTTVCRVMRLVEQDNVARVEKVLLELRSGRNHIAGRIKFGPDGFLYIAYGDVGQPSLAQDLNVLQGKILRITSDGAPAPGNPLPNHPYLYAWGLRDPQGLAWDAAGQLYATDHGNVSRDEVNIIYRGKNYGWPNCEARCGDLRYEDPVKLFYPETAAPSGCTFFLSGVIPQWRDSFFLGALGLSNNTFARHVRRIRFKAPASGTIVAEEALYRGKYGRIRNVVEGRDGYLYFMTSNGAGTDKILRVRPN